ncbi:response regulator transcription factor [Flavobacterium sp. CYK-55]|uniref:LytR/AlgR family response regulator transcription factor n=1 Tax=Flavobacterium sp. CYK-55 TaxID=2835529 RepID=UPI001BCB8352|nr:LytTR family DNA-binding domain-containing protein [Flavobacterium sp. CYK-55]MBS7787189.1 response regulator transcription factor [Flavobacterium sp. CYK-55]
MKCIIIDDEVLSREILKIMIQKIPILEIKGEFSSAIEAMKFLNSQKMDLIFLDIHMPNFTGFDMIQTIKNIPQVILVTTDEHLAIDAFGYDCITDYLVKPLMFERFKRSIERVLKKRESNFQITPIQEKKSKEIYVNINNRLVKIDISKINAIQVKGDYIDIKTEDGKLVVHTTLKKIAEKLPAHIFLKIHRSHIINIEKIIDIQDNSVLIGKDVIPISKKNKPDLLKSLNLL